jgi:hypothetical protein
MPSVEILDQLSHVVAAATAMVAGAFLLAKWFDVSRRSRRRLLPVRVSATRTPVVRRVASGR